MDLDNDLIQKINKIISNMVLTTASAVAGVEQVSILFSQADNKTLLTIQILNEHKPLSGSLIDKLSKKDNINLNTKDINIYLTSLLLEFYSAEVNYARESNYIEINIKI
jgi:pyoverdine/dityrosine biosynthesis protein Dit1